MKARRTRLLARSTASDPSFRREIETMTWMWVWADSNKAGMMKKRGWRATRLA
jgi:hypothetical protein